MERMCAMKANAYVFVFVQILAATLYVAHAGGNTPTDAPHVGEVREFAIAPGNDEVVAQLHRDGWLEARGQLLSAPAFLALFRTIGRTWTAEDVAEGRFAIPDLYDRSQRSVSSDNPFGVLGPGDVLESRRTAQQWVRPSPISHWIFTGQDVTRLETYTAAR
jgi:hypothetical protein